MPQGAFVDPSLVPSPGMIMAVRGRKHVTVFRRSRQAPGAGSASQKKKFAACATKTKGIASRAERNAQMEKCLS